MNDKDTNEKLPVIKTEKTETLGSRAYTPDQVKFIAKHQNDRNALATKLSYSAGLRAHELLTLRLVKEQTPDIRPSDSLKFSDRDGEIYTVVGNQRSLNTEQISPAIRTT